MKAYQLCPVCAKIVEIKKLKEHYAHNARYPFEWQKSYTSKIERWVPVNSFVEGHCFDELSCIYIRG